jgi:hypothetical protein
MSVFKLYKFKDISSLERHLQGAVTAGANTSKGYRWLVGKTVIFSKPSVQTVTFTPGAFGPQDLTFAEVKAQLEAGLAGSVIKVYALDNSLVIIETTPSLGVKITGGTGLSILGFDPLGATGLVYNYADGSSAAVAPHFVAAYPMDGHHVLMVRE